jgi:acyl carrier protein phosphodiesterase
MNFLAHQYLSKHNHELMIGNFIADAVKGNNYEIYSEGIIQGIKMHRQIDTFTDTHPITNQSRAKLMPRYKKYSGVIVDVFYDHFLAINWSSYHQQPLPNFVDEIYKLMHNNKALLPAKSQYILPYMIEHNWLLNYGKVEGIQRTLSGMAKRTAFVSHMQHATEELLAHYQDFNKEFTLFFEDAQHHFKNSF